MIINAQMLACKHHRDVFKAHNKIEHAVGDHRTREQMLVCKHLGNKSESYNERCRGQVLRSVRLKYE